MARKTERSGARPEGRETQRPERSRWQLTTRSRFALVLGLAGLAVAGVQVAMLSDPPTVIQIVVVAFWGLVGFGYLLSAAVQRLRERRRPAPAPPAAPPVEEIVPVPVRPARPRPRREESPDAGATSAVPAREGRGAQDREPVAGAGRAARSEAVRTSAVPAREGRGAQDREPVAGAGRAARAEAARTPAPRTGTVRPAARTEAVRRPAPTRAGASDTRRPAPAVSPRVATRVHRPARPTPAPVPVPVPEPTTVALRPAAAAPAPARADSRPAAGLPATTMLAGGGSALSFGSARPDPLDPSTPLPVLPPAVDLAPAPRAPSPISGPLPTAGARTFGDAPRAPGRRRAAETEAPKPPRHRADVEDPVAARRGTPGPNSGRHASAGHAGR